ncbi:putative membrane protein EpsK [Caulifigura coniformis]|uniref:Putative membrane protein EpsK n=1 Tax=Caulifigura coniformis TaxID=2527983 RepID=A0A517SI00_9PLAN|nr:oligosaccharide flippase family protein [Caulifigura coniformis]QDT55751.1 putative membrane protein EpsK [Caulifigura coniformis]
MSLTRSVSAKWLAHLVVMAVGFYLMPYVMKTIGEEGYGAWVFVNSIAGYSSLLYMGFGSTVCRFVADRRARQDWDGLNAVASGVFAVYFVAAGGVMAVSAGLALAAPALGDWGDVPVSDVRIAMILLGLNIAIGMLGSVYGGVLIATQRFDLYSAIEAIIAVARLVLTITFLQKQGALVVLGAIFLGVTILENAVTVWWARCEIPTLSIRRRHINRAVLKECFSFSLFTALRGMAVRVIHLTDVVVIGIILGKAAAVPYYVALRLVQMISTPLEKIGDVVLPKAGDMHARGERDGLEGLCAKAMGMGFLLSAAFLIGSVYFGEMFLTTWMGPDLEGSYLILIVLAAAQVIAQPLIILRQALTAIGDVKRPAYIDVAQAVANFVLSITFVKIWGIVGVAWGTFLPLVLIEGLVLFPYAMKALEFHPGHLLAKVILPQVPVLVALTAYCEAIRTLEPGPGWKNVALIAAGAGGVLAASMGWRMLRPRQEVALAG